MGRVAVNMSAGALRYPRRRFVPLSILGGVSWAAYSATIGVAAGQWLKGQPLLSAVTGVVFALAIGLIVDRVSAARRRRTGPALLAGRGESSGGDRWRGETVGMTAKTQTRRAPARRTLVAVGVCVAAVILYSILVPLHTVAYGTVLPLAMLLGAGVCGAPLLALVRPRIAIAAFCISAFALPVAVAADRDVSWPWPWSVPALLAFAVFVATITVAHGCRMGLVPLAISILASLAAPLVLPDAAPPNAAAADLIVTASIATVAFGVAVLLAGRLRLGRELTRERELTAVEQSRRMLVEERTRIARELHDVVAHSMSLIQVRASTARYRIPELPGAGVAEFDDIAATARDSLSEMRRLLGVLRTDDQTPQLVPQQGLTDIPDLVDSTRRAGVDVSLSLSAAPIEAPQSVQIAAFRIVQEAVSNAVRHAPGSAVSITVDAAEVAVTVRVHNDAAVAPPPAAGSGHGLRGMRERVAVVGGSLTVGPDPAGGWSVAAVLPWADEEERS